MSGGEAYDAVVLGAGPGGIAAATQVARRGGRACLVEKGPLGGVCLNVGCMPTKAMLAASDLCRRMRAGGAFGIEADGPRVDGRVFMRRVAGVVADLRQRTEAALKANRGIDVVRGVGRLVGAGTVAVETDDGARTLRGRTIVIATGSSPARPDFLPWGSPRMMTTDEAVVAEDVPASVLVMGGGVIGCEFATVYAELGIPTTLVEMLDGLLPQLDAEAGTLVADVLAERGVEVLTGRRVVRMAADHREVVAALDDGREVRADCALIAVGRRPRLEGIGLAEAGVRVECGAIAVDHRCRTSVEGVYAVGDAAEPRQYAHLADRMGRVAAENIMGVECSDDRSVVPVGVYTHPEVASVGFSLAEAKERFGRVRVLRHSYAHSSMGVVCGETAGQLKVLADGDSGRIFGATWIGPHATDMIQEFALALRLGLTLRDLHGTIHAHPTFQEAASAVADAWAAQADRKRPGRDA
ncbi:MAG TPA: dihydrolipoyl dehydrogenase [Phycisphaerae bacterium]|nr:dihydrolipoyl dehydrogenase [Phycisphaerae bacterium]